MTNVSDTDAKVAASAMPAKNKKRTGKIAQPKTSAKTEKAAKQKGERADTPPQNAPAARAPTKQQQLIEALKQPQGASIAQLSERFGWLPHTTRAALTGLRTAGHAIERSTSTEGTTVYRIA
jgi:hypothetical protein